MFFANRRNNIHKDDYKTGTRVPKAQYTAFSECRFLLFLYSYFYYSYSYISIPIYIYPAGPPPKQSVHHTPSYQFIILPALHIMGMQQVMGQVPVGRSQVIVIQLHQIRVLMGLAQYLSLIHISAWGPSRPAARTPPASPLTGARACSLRLPGPRLPAYPQGPTWA